MDANNALKAALHPGGLNCDDLQWCDVIAREDYLVSEVIGPHHTKVFRQRACGIRATSGNRTSSHVLVNLARDPLHR